jgi:hypothetical protein
MKFFAQLGAELEKAWRARDYDHAFFPEIAVAALDRMPPAEHVTPQDVERWVCTTDALGMQRNIGSPFGNPPVTVFSSGQFYIDVLFWLDGTTTIHEHGFCGAFHVLAGSSMESRYTFATETRLGDHVKLGELALAGVEHLRQGNTRPIHPGDALIHALFHLERPSVSVVVRTEGHPFIGPQHNYCRSGLAYNPFFRPEHTIRKVQILELLDRTDAADRFDIASEAIANCDSLSTLLILDSLAARSAEDPRFGAMLEALPPRHAALRGRFQKYVEERYRERNIASRRRLITKPEHRFLLALLLTVPSRRELLRIVGEAHPGVAPADTVAAWIAELSAMKGPGADEPNVLGIHLEDTSLRVLRHLLDGVSDGQVLERLGADFDVAEVNEHEDDLLLLCRRFRSSSVFAPLFLS